MPQQPTKRSHKKEAVHFYSNSFLITCILAFIMLVILLPVTLRAQGGLMVIPKRVVFEGRERTHALNIANSSNDTVRYTVSVVEMKMMEDGTFKEIKEADPGQNFASSHLRIFPKVIVLGPNEAQTLKVQLINTANMAPGEYRSHISFNVVPDEKLKSPPLLKMVTNLKVKLIPIFSITIPAIIRIGENNTKLNFSNLLFEMAGDTPRLSVTLNRIGTMSLYGTLSVSHISPEGNETHVASLKGLAVYVPNSTRTVNMELDNKVGVDYTTGKLHIMYATLIEERPVKVGEAELVIAAPANIEKR